MIHYDPVEDSLSDASRHLNLALNEEKKINDLLQKGMEVNQNPILIDIGNGYLQMAEDAQKWADYWLRLAVEDENQAHKLVKLSRRVKA